VSRRPRKPIRSLAKEQAEADPKLAEFKKLTKGLQPDETREMSAELSRVANLLIYFLSQGTTDGNSLALN